MKRPFVYLNMVGSLDGRIDPPGGRIRILSSDADRKNMDLLRYRADAILIGAKTFCQPNAFVGIRDEKLKKGRKSLGRFLNPIIVTLSKTGASLLSSKILLKGELNKVIFLSKKAKPSVVEKLSRYSMVYVLDGNEVSLEVLLKILVEEFKVTRLLVEGGANLNAQLLKQDLIDEVNLTIAPVIFGGAGRKGIIDRRLINPSFIRRFKLIKTRKQGDDLFLVYRRNRPFSHKLIST